MPQRCTRCACSETSSISHWFHTNFPYPNTSAQTLGRPLRDPDRGTPTGCPPVANVANRVRRHRQAQESNTCPQGFSTVWISRTPPSTGFPTDRAPMPGRAAESAPRAAQTGPTQEHWTPWAREPLPSDSAVDRCMTTRRPGRLLPRAPLHPPVSGALPSPVGSVRSRHHPVEPPLPTRGRGRPRTATSPRSACRPTPTNADPPLRLLRQQGTADGGLSDHLPDTLARTAGEGTADGGGPGGSAGLLQEGRKLGRSCGGGVGPVLAASGPAVVSGRV